MHDVNPLLVDYDRRREEARSAPERFDWICSLQHHVPRHRVLMQRLAAIVTR